MIIRPATTDDAKGISAVLMALTAAGLRSRPDDADFALQNYIDAADGILCSVAEKDGKIVGLQSLKHATKDNPYGVTPGWGIIGTHIHPDTARKGIGKTLFTASLMAAQTAGLEHIDATIGAKNKKGLAYYAAMGFEKYRTNKDTISKCYSLAN